jgi:hypothetical protein
MKEAFDSLKGGLKFDKYTLQARVRPSLLVLLPALVTVALWLPGVWTFLGSIAALVSVCGLTLLLAEVARYRGRKVEHTMIADNGGKFTTLFLRHSDLTISSTTKRAYHSFLTKSSKRKMPSSDEERADPAGADDCYRGATEWLLEKTRSEKTFPLVKAENISYGFRRNLFGLKAPALVLIAACISLDGWFTSRNFHSNEVHFEAGCTLAMALAVAAAIWIFIIRMDFVEDAGRAYALRLLAQCDVLDGGSQPKAPRKKKSSPAEA